uniref:Uncharacterized protein n=1 Tax=Neogobius melanostomus TaxID=47308 RepID=A0A8C6WFC7_9GOBI
MRLMRPLESVSKRLLKAVIALELLGVFGAYGLFQWMNSSRGPSSSSFLLLFIVSSLFHGIRESDRDAWSKQQ